MRKLNPELFNPAGGVAALLPAKPQTYPPLSPQPATPPPQTNLVPGKSIDEAKLNKTEQAFLANLREQRKEAIGVQSITLKLAGDCRFTPDFSYLEAGRLILVDVKGFQREDALIKAKVAARQFHWIEFQIAKKHKAGWYIKTVKP